MKEVNIHQPILLFKLNVGYQLFYTFNRHTG